MALDLTQLIELGVIPKDPPQPLDEMPVSFPKPDTGSVPSGRAAMNILQPWKSDALLAFGAGLLSGNGFLDGLAKGAQGAQAARHAWENPERKMLADGAFTYEQSPDGSTRLVPNQPIQDYQTQQAMIAFAGKQALQKQQAQAIADRMAANNDAQMDRTAAMIAASDRRQAAQIASQEGMHSQDVGLRQQEIDAMGPRDPYTKSFLEAQGKADAEIPGQVNQANLMREKLLRLKELANSGKIGLGLGMGNKAMRALTSVVPEAGAVTGIDPDAKREAEQIIANIRVFGSKAFQGQGQVSNYERQMANAAQPSLDMGSSSFNKAIDEMIGFSDAELKRLQEGQSRRGTAAQTGRQAREGVTSHGVKWRIVD